MFLIDLGARRMGPREATPAGSLMYSSWSQTKKERSWARVMEAKGGSSVK